MNVTLLSHTPDAMNLLLRTKNTRLKFESDPATWTEAMRDEHIAYMKDTIKSSWEFVDYTFQIEGVTRAFTHQLVRTRTGSYAQESQRTIDASGNGWLTPEVPLHGPNGEFNAEVPRAVQRNELYDQACHVAFDTYSTLLKGGMPAQDARGILPTATLTSIIAKFSLRTLHEMAKVRLCVRTQGEYQDVFRAMRAAVINVHPWVEDFQFIEVACVSEGTCAFPRYGKTNCKFYDPRMDLSSLKAETRQKFWSLEKQVAVPVAKSGRTM